MVHYSEKSPEWAENVLPLPSPLEESAKLRLAETMGNRTIGSLVAAINK